MLWVFFGFVFFGLSWWRLDRLRRQADGQVRFYAARLHFFRNMNFFLGTFCWRVSRMGRRFTCCSFSLRWSLRLVIMCHGDSPFGCARRILALHFFRLRFGSSCHAALISKILLPLGVLSVGISAHLRNSAICSSYSFGFSFFSEYFGRHTSLPQRVHKMQISPVG